MTIMSYKSINDVINKLFELEIHSIGMNGDGVALSYGLPERFSNEYRFYVPGALEGEKILAKVHKIIQKKIFCRLMKVITPSKDREQEDCNKFLDCGGCNFRNVNSNWINKWKIQQLITKTEPLKIKDKILPLSSSEKSKRRRVVFSVKANNRNFYLGFNSRFTQNIIDIRNCRTIISKLTELYLKLKLNLNQFIIKKSNFKIKVNYLDNGADILFDINKQNYKEIFNFDQLIQFLISLNTVRVSFKTNNRIQMVQFNGKNQNTLGKLNGKILYSLPPPGGFLQPTKEGEREIIKFVIKAVHESKKVADLFCGSGTLSIPISQSAEILCADSNQSSLSGLKEALKQQKSLNKNKIINQDLLSLPISHKTLKDIDTIVLNPPSKGAKKQLKEIILSNVTNIVYVSCNLNTFFRDAKFLLENGYSLEWLKPIDQFPNTMHLEIVSKFIEKK